MRCPVCNDAELEYGSRDVPYTYKGHSTAIPSVVGRFCPSCGEGVFDEQQGDALSAAMLEFNREVNASFVKPEKISSVRQKLGLDQRQAAEIFGGGVNAFSRYETGKARPSIALLHLLKILDKYPELLHEISPASRKKSQVETVLKVVGPLSREQSPQDLFAYAKSVMSKLFEQIDARADRAAPQDLNSLMTSNSNSVNTVLIGWVTRATEASLSRRQLFSRIVDPSDEDQYEQSSPFTNFEPDNFRVTKNATSIH